MDRNMNDASGTRGAWRMFLWGGLAIVLALPALAMSLGAEGVDWSASDFVIMGAVLALLGLGIEGAVRMLPSRRGRLIAIAAVSLVFLTVWVELAVGVFGTPIAGS